MTILIANPLAAGNTRISRTASIPNLANFTLCGWTKIENMCGGDTGIFPVAWIGRAAANGFNRANALQLVVSNRDAIKKHNLNLYSMNEVIQSTLVNTNMGSPGFGTWFFWAITGNVNVLKAYWARENETEWESYLEANLKAAPAGFGAVMHGADLYSNVTANCGSMKLTMVKQWNTALSSEELLQQKFKQNPVRMANLQSTWNMNGPAIANDLATTLGVSAPYTITNSTPTANVSYVTDFPQIERNPLVVINASGMMSESKRLVNNYMHLQNNYKQSGLQYSGNLQHAIWIKQFSVAKANAGVGPYGERDATKLIATTQAGVRHWLTSANLFLNANSTISIFAKRGEYSKLGIYKLTNNVGVVFDLITGNVENMLGTVKNANVATQGNHTATVDVIGNGWYRLSLYLSAAGNAAENSNHIFAVDIGYSNTFTGDGHAGVFVWGPQQEAGNITQFNFQMMAARENPLHSAQNPNTLYLTVDNRGNRKTFNPNTEALFV